MNSETGEIREFDDSQAKTLSTDWVRWTEGQPLFVRGCHFKVHNINAKGNRITLKAISKREFDQITEKQGGIKLDPHAATTDILRERRI